jgi:Spy/CpxP family protein refolding chaperone
MTRFRLWIATSVLLAAGAGFAGGLAMERYRGWHGGPPREPHMLRDLNLTDEQRAKILPIWEEAMRNGPKPPSPEMMDQAQQELESKVNALLNEEQRKQYELIQAEYREKLQAARKTLDEIFRPAEEKTRALLTPEQQKKFDEALERMHKGGPPGRGFGRPPREGSRDGYGPGPGGDHGPRD